MTALYITMAINGSLIFLLMYNLLNKESRVKIICSRTNFVCHRQITFRQVRI